MSALGSKLRTAADRIIFWCPGCDESHQISVAPGRWTFDGNAKSPTFAPSVLVRGTAWLTEEQHALVMRGEPFEPVQQVCHSFVVAGQIQFLGDCTHPLVGQTVPLPAWPQEVGE